MSSFMMIISVRTSTTTNTTPMNEHNEKNEKKNETRMNRISGVDGLLTIKLSISSMKYKVVFRFTFD